MPSIQEIQNTLADIRSAHQKSGTEQSALAEMANYIKQNNIDPGLVAQAATNIAPTAWDANRVTQTVQQYTPKPPASSNAGLNQALETLAQGTSAATNRIGLTQQQVGELYRQGLQFLSPYANTGASANQLQAALSGALGPEAQQQAFAQYQASPGVEFAQKEAERALLRNASATGGLGGGNILRDLTQLAAGTAMQDFGNQFSRIGEVANRGYGAATTASGLQGQQAQVQSGLGQFAANIPMQAALAGSGYQFQAGRDISSNISGTTSALSTLLNQQGAGMADILGNTTNSINNLYQQAAAGDANSLAQLQAILGNLSTQSASMVGGLPIIQNPPSNLLGQVGQVAGGVGGLAAGLGYGQNPATAPVYGTPNYYDNANYQSPGLSSSYYA